ncbi:hypothetical protein F511_01380 [Dorcoceras hygrometricum]|uniref:Protein MIZU-KUSSEI 1-like n=1 Tax=Dorcoceras hygrometricum TaxID=472368 RepID=A0A2Z7D4P1_9LAMI|nr:hypothetical protein F511_01380 [Dorcoceras hygrometricum]
MAENPVSLSSLHRTTRHSTTKTSKSNELRGGRIFGIFKLLPMLTTGSKMAALLMTLHRKPLLADKATTITLFGYSKGRLTIAIQENPHQTPFFLLQLPLSTAALHREISSDVLRIAIESETKTRKKKLMEEFVWAVYCNGRKLGYSIRRMRMSDDEMHVMNLLRGVSMGAGVLPSLWEKERAEDRQLTYIRARFDRVVGSKDSESFYMINPEGASGQELSIFFVRMKQTA